MEHQAKIALVSGANRGIGEAIASGLARKGITVLIGCREPESGRALVEALGADGFKAEAVPLDTTKHMTLEALSHVVRSRFGKLDILVNNAGIALDHACDLSLREKLEQTFAVNVVGAADLIDTFIPLLIESGQGRIVNVSSSLSSFGRRQELGWQYTGFSLPTYQASKAALNSLTLSYAKALRDWDIKVNAICPGYVATAATNFAGPRSPDEGAAIAIRYALLDADGPTGVFAEDSGEIPW